MNLLNELDIDELDQLDEIDGIDEIEPESPDIITYEFNIDASDYSDIITDHGTIRIIHEMTLGDTLIISAIALILIFMFIKNFIQMIWR